MHWRRRRVFHYEPQGARFIGLSFANPTHCKLTPKHYPNETIGGAFAIINEKTQTHA